MQRKSGPWSRELVADTFRQAEHLLYAVVGLALAAAGFVLFTHLVFKFVSDAVAGKQNLAQSLLEAVDELLLVFIFAELLHTVRVVLAMDVLRTEPFLMVGIVAAIRRFIVASAEASGHIGGPKFDDLMMELGVLMAAVLVLGFTIWLLRFSRREPEELSEDG
jgi:uncharacterized membrane protein (DUF373 family)